MASKPQPRYTREALISSKLFSAYQQDFLRAILTKETYTIAEARKALQKYYEPKGVN